MGFNSFKATWERMNQFKVTAPETSVLHALAYIMNDKTGACFPSHQQIADKTNLSRTTVKTALRGLREKGIARASFQRNAGLFAIAREGCLSGLQRGS